MNGIDALISSAGAGDIVVNSAADVYASDRGIQAAATSSGDVNINTSSGTIVKSSGGLGILGRNYGSGNVNIDADSEVYGSTYGLYGGTFGGGDIAIDFDGDVTASTGRGVYARGLGFSSADVSITSSNAAATVSSGTVGVWALAYGTTTIAIAGDVKGGTNGVDIRGGGYVDIDVNNVTASGGDAIHIDDFGLYAPDVNVLVTGDLKATDDGIEIDLAGGGNIKVTTTTGKTISADSDGSTGGEGIDVYTAGGNIDVNSKAAIDADPGIYSSTTGTGDIDIDVYAGGAITADNGGIRAHAEDGIVDILVEASVEGDDDDSGSGVAIFADVDGTGSVKVVTTSDGDIVGDNRAGIRVEVDGGSGGVGIYDVYGNVFVDADGNVGTSGTPVDDHGIYIRNFDAASGTGGYVSVYGDGTIHSGRDGISVQTAGLGAVTVDFDGDIYAGTAVTATGAQAGIAEVTSSADINVDMGGNVTSTGNGIYAWNLRSGNIDITSTGTLTAGPYCFASGIVAEASSGDIKVDADGAVISYNDGIHADVASDGNVTVDSSDSISTSGIGGHGIYAYTPDGNFAITANDVDTAGRNADGINAKTADGTGAITATSISTDGNDSIGIYGYANGSLIIGVDTVTTLGDGSDGIVGIDPASDVQITFA